MGNDGLVDCRRVEQLSKDDYDADYLLAKKIATGGVLLGNTDDRELGSLEGFFFYFNPCSFTIPQ